MFFNERLFSEEVQKTRSFYSIFYTFVFVNVVVMLKINTIVFYVQKFLLNLQTIRFFLKIFLLIGVTLVKNVYCFLEVIQWCPYPFFLNSSRWLSKFQKHQCKEFYRIKTPFKLFKKFLNIMVRVYLNKLIEILDKLNVSHHEYIFMRKHICWQACELISDFCSDTNVDFF